MRNCVLAAVFGLSISLAFGEATTVAPAFCERGLLMTPHLFRTTPFYWHFSSDHLPIVGNVHFPNRESLRVLSWNVLNNNYLHYIYGANSQGLLKSEITSLEDRPARTLQLLSEMFQDVRPDLVALQEVSPEVLERLTHFAQQTGYQIVETANPKVGANGHQIDFGVIMFHPSSVIAVSEVANRSFMTDAKQATKYIQSLVFQTSQSERFSFTNVHRYAEDHSVLEPYLDEQNGPSVVVGDFNLERPQMDRLLDRHSNYTLMEKEPGSFTHIDTSRSLVEYDHILVAGGLKVTQNARLTADAQKHFSILPVPN